MGIQELWEKALKNTEVLRPRIQDLDTFSTTRSPYILLCESSLNGADTIVRKGEVFVERPSLILPSNSPQFEGFDFDKDFNLDPRLLTNFLLIRGVRFPSLKYNNKTDSLKIYDGELGKAISYYSDKLQRQEDVLTGLIACPDDCWQLSLLIFISGQVVRSAGADINKLIEEFKKKRKRKI